MIKGKSFIFVKINRKIVWLLQNEVLKILDITNKSLFSVLSSLQNLEAIDSKDEKNFKRVPKLKTEMQLRSNIAYTHAINVMKVESNNVSMTQANPI